MNQKYCSIDLEFTGFDPEKEQILEIGFAFFEVGKNGFEVTETWSQVFKPTIEVHQKILGLTGITQVEIDTAPSISEHKDFLSEKLHDAILVAHNPTLDVKFLELAGVKLSGQYIDTLELVQFLLPTHHSYNLENLMHYFGIAHKDSHRALADCLSTISLLEKMIAIHARFSDELKGKLNDIFVKADFIWAHFLKLDFDITTTQVNDSLIQGDLAEDQLQDISGPIIIDTKHDLHESRVVNSLQQEDGEKIVVMRSKQEVLKLWQAGLVEGVFQSKDLFNREAFEQFILSAQTTEELRFILKILVWLETNWQTKTVLDLNLSFFGGQFKNFITGGDYVPGSNKILACDYGTFSFLSDHDLEINRQVVICDLQRYESFLTYGSKEKISWYYFSYTLKSIYNPETEYGQSKYSTEVIESLAAVDLFFGLVQLILRKNLKQLDYISVLELEMLHSVFYNRLHQAAQNLSEKLSSLAGLAGNDALHRLGDNLKSFFTLEENLVKWIELSEENVTLHSQPIEIKELVHGLVDKYQGIRFTDTLIQPILLSYYVERLGLSTEIDLDAENFINLETEVLGLNLENPKDRLIEISNIGSPVVLIFANSSSVKTFFKENFDSLGVEFKVLAQEYSGSGNKIFRNFSIFPNALLCATSQFINKQKYTVNSGSVLYLDWPELDLKHPYIQSILSVYANSFPTLPEVLVFGEFILNLKQLSGQKLPKLFFGEKAKQISEKLLRKS